MTPVPFTDLAAMAREVWPEIEPDYLACLLDGAYIGGPPVASFEREWAAYCGAGHAVGVANGTDALQLTLTALGLGAGDEVVVPANTFIATAAAVVRAGATPRFADVSADTLLMTPCTLTEAITPRTRAVIVVHLFGQVPDMAGLLAVAGQAGIAVIEDAAQAHGAEWDGRRAGSFGEAACFSFYPGEEPGRLRRRWRGRHLASGARRSAADHWPTTAGPMAARTTSTTASARTAAWTLSRRSCYRAS